MSGATATSLKETLTRQPGPLCAGVEAAVAIATPVRASEGLLQSRDLDCQGPVAGQDLAPENDETGWGQRTPALGRNGDENATENTGSVGKGDTQQRLWARSGKVEDNTGNRVDHVL